MTQISRLNFSKTDSSLLFITRIIRLFAYGLLSIVLVLYLVQIGLGESKIGILLTLTLFGDVLISLRITTWADRIGRKRMLMFGTILMILAGIGFTFTTNFLLLTLTATIGVISPSGKEVGPFLSIEQAALSQLLPNFKRTKIFAWYNLVGSFAEALGALFGGTLVHFMQRSGISDLESYRSVLIVYSSAGVLLLFLFGCLSESVEVKSQINAASGTRLLGLYSSRKIIFKLSILFALDAFAGGFIIQSLIAYWFHIKYGISIDILGSIFFGTNILAGISALIAARIATKIGLINTMFFTHLPSNVLLILVPLMPNVSLAIIILLLRFSISQMDVPTRQSYTMSVVAPDERSAASGVTNVARSIGSSLSPIICAQFFVVPSLLGLPFILAGGIKIIYDLILYHSFKTIKPVEENRRDLI